MRESKLRVQVLRALASGARGALPLVGRGMLGCHCRKGNASNARGVTAGKMGRNSSNTNIHSL